ACDFLLRRGAKVTISEKKRPEEIKNYLEELAAKGAIIEAGGHQQDTFLQADLIIPSPGVPLLKEIREAEARDIPVFSEVELAFRFLQGKIVGITGSNGKSTTATLIHKILKEAGRPSFLAGNIGTPLISFIEGSRPDHIYVTELSSFQLTHTQSFKAHVGVLLNITPDHLDWHPSFIHYSAAKKKLILSLEEKDVAVLNRDDSEVWSLHSQTRADVFGFSRQHQVDKGMFIREGWIYSVFKKQNKFLKTSDIQLFGLHNQENVMASALAAWSLGVKVPKIRDSIQTFKGLEHRLEKVSTIEGVTFYNDSKATNVDAALKSIQSFQQKIIPILGGRDKGGDFSALRPFLKQKAKAVILIGEAAEKILKELRNISILHQAHSMKEAVEKGFSLADQGDIVLLAPACTSFDMFANFEERGQCFKKEVRSLEEKILQGNKK
ncbi:MAG: UDP-N-acetylmuramoyl-L-alanine--D-glutamate ligase, partial [Acidobacteriota bacterium]